MRQLTARERKLVAIALLLGAVATVWLGIVSPVIGGFVDRAGQRAELQTQYDRNLRMLSAIPIWKHEAIAQRRTASQFGIQATTQQLAALQLQQRLARAIDAVGGLLRNAGSTENVAPGSVRVHGEADLTMAQLYQLLRHLEGEEPYVVVEYISVGANRAFETGHLAPMDVRVQLSATYHPVQPE